MDLTFTEQLALRATSFRVETTNAKHALSPIVCPGPLSPTCVRGVLIFELDYANTTSILHLFADAHRTTKIPCRAHLQRAFAVKRLSLFSNPWVNPLMDNDDTFVPLTSTSTLPVLMMYRFERILPCWITVTPCKNRGNQHEWAAW